METGANFKQTSHAAVKFDATAGGFSNARDDFEQCGFAGAIAADYPDHLTALNCSEWEGHKVAGQKTVETPPR